MNEIFADKVFLNKANNLPYLKNKILEIMNEIKEKNPELNINVFICILDKIIDPTSSSIYRSAALYKYSVELWNEYIFKNYKKNFDLLISYENICF